MTKILRVKGAFLEILRGKLEDSNFSIFLGLRFWVVSFLWVYVPFLRVYVGFMYGFNFRAHRRLLKSRLNEMNDWRPNKFLISEEHHDDMDRTYHRLDSWNIRNM